MTNAELTIFSFIVTLLSGAFGLIFKRLNEMDKRLREAPSRKEVSEEIEIRIEPTRVMNQEIKEDIKEMKEALKKLADKS